MSISREKLLQAVEQHDGSYLSVVEIAGLLEIPVNTAKAHFSRQLFQPVKQVERGKKIFDLETVKLYGIWLFLGPNSDCPLSYSSNERDDILRDANVGEFWDALGDSQQQFVSVMLSANSNEKQP